MRVGRSPGWLAALLLGWATVAPACGRGSSPVALPESAPVAVSLEPAEIRVGDTARLAVIIDHAAAERPELPEIDQGKALVVTDRRRAAGPLAGERPGGRERTTFDLLLTSFELGERRVGAANITFTGPGGAKRELPFPAVVLRTKSILPTEDTPLRGPKGPARWPPPLLRWAGLAAGLLLLAAGGFLGARRLLSRGTIASAEQRPPAPPHEIALKALAALRAAPPPGQPQIEVFYRELSAILRRYLEARFGLRAPERTTEEFMREAAGSGLLSGAHQQLVRAFLEQCDLVKFARHLPPPEAPAQALGAAERLVLETREPAGPRSREASRP